MFQFPIYGWVFGRAWVKRRFWPEIVVLGASHVLASMIGFTVMAGATR